MAIVRLSYVSVYPDQVDHADAHAQRLRGAPRHCLHGVAHVR